MWYLNIWYYIRTSFDTYTFLNYSTIFYQYSETCSLISDIYNINVFKLNRSKFVLLLIDWQCNFFADEWVIFLLKTRRTQLGSSLFIPVSRRLIQSFIIFEVAYFFYNKTMQRNIVISRKKKENMHFMKKIFIVL